MYSGPLTFLHSFCYQPGTILKDKLVVFKGRIQGQIDNTWARAFDWHVIALDLMPGTTYGGPKTAWSSLLSTLEHRWVLAPKPHNNNHKGESNNMH